MTKYHKLICLNKISAFQEADSPRSKCWEGRFHLRSLLLTYGQLSSGCVLTWSLLWCKWGKRKREIMSSGPLVGWKWKSLSRVQLFLQTRILEWIAYSFSSRSSWPRNWTGVSCIAGGFFTNWVIRDAPIMYQFCQIRSAHLCLRLTLTVSLEAPSPHVSTQGLGISILIWGESRCQSMTQTVDGQKILLNKN